MGEITLATIVVLAVFLGVERYFFEGDDFLYHAAIVFYGIVLGFLFSLLIAGLMTFGKGQMADVIPAVLPVPVTIYAALLAARWSRRRVKSRAE